MNIPFIVFDAGRRIFPSHSLAGCFTRTMIPDDLFLQRPVFTTITAVIVSIAPRSR